METKERITVSLISLGCDKNRVESEYLLSELAKEFEIVPDHADVTVINTCAFIESAVKESLDNIFAESAKGSKVIVTGCFPMRYKKEDLLEKMPEVSAFLDNQHYADICKIVYNVCVGERVRLQNQSINTPICLTRTLDSLTHYAYLRIADGCSNCCTYCAIPRIRGKYIAVPPKKIVAEAKDLIERYGTREFIIVAQDVSRYSYEDTNLLGLIDMLEDAGVEKMRLMYCYPEAVSDELIERIATDDKIAKYIDVPLQHINDEVLKAMNRRSTKKDILTLLEKLKSKGITVRSTFITGFPGETRRQHKELLEFINKGYITFAGFFPYFREEGTKAYSMPKQVSKLTKKTRLKELENAETRVTLSYLEKLVGTTIKVTFDNIDYDKNLFVGHMDGTHPTVDSKIYFSADRTLNQGEDYDVLIQYIDKLDLVGVVK